MTPPSARTRASRKRKPSRPDFAASFPPSKELDELLRTFEAGDYGAVREGAARLIASSGEPEVRRAARELARRLSPHPITILLFVLAVGLLLVLSAHYLLHAH